MRIIYFPEWGSNLLKSPLMVRRYPLKVILDYDFRGDFVFFAFRSCINVGYKKTNIKLYRINLAKNYFKENRRTLLRPVVAQGHKV